ncbi:MFS transporter [Nonomuraea jabiensis]|uniref:MFS transporter n=1 Tax=Nonomuraea jabiensis TaxID=882448 RepID=UPI003689EC91
MNTREWLVLVTLCGATFMTGLDYSIITVALPELGRDLGFATRGDLQWVVTACLLPTAALMPLFGRVSDVVGWRRLFAVGVTAFTGFSLLAALAPVPGVLVGARAGQGVAAAMIGPTALALMTTAFAEGPKRTRAMGVNGALLSLGFVAGTIGGGLVTSGLSWRWTMLILVGIGVVVLVGAFAVLPGDSGRSAVRLDVPGAVLASAGLFTLVYGISTLTWVGVAAAVLLLGAFLVVEGRHAAPLVPPRLLRRPTVKWGMAVALVTFGMCGGATLLLSVYMQDVLGWSALRTGLGFLGEGVAALVAGGLAARLIGAYGAPAAVAAEPVPGQHVGAPAHRPGRHLGERLDHAPDPGPEQLRADRRAGPDGAGQAVQVGPLVVVQPQRAGEPDVLRLEPGAPGPEELAETHRCAVFTPRPDARRSWSPGTASSGRSPGRPSSPAGRGAGRA